jgi:hypothetical protein
MPFFPAAFPCAFAPHPPNPHLPHGVERGGIQAISGIVRFHRYAGLTLSPDHGQGLRAQTTGGPNTPAPHQRRRRPAPRRSRLISPLPPCRSSAGAPARRRRRRPLQATGRNPALCCIFDPRAAATVHSVTVATARYARTTASGPVTDRVASPSPSTYCGGSPPRCPLRGHTTRQSTRAADRSTSGAHGSAGSAPHGHRAACAPSACGACLKAPPRPTIHAPVRARGAAPTGARAVGADRSTWCAPALSG